MNTKQLIATVALAVLGTSAFAGGEFDPLTGFNLDAPAKAAPKADKSVKATAAVAPAAAASAAAPAASATTATTTSASREGDAARSTKSGS